MATWIAPRLHFTGRVRSPKGEDLYVWRVEHGGVEVGQVSIPPDLFWSRGFRDPAIIGEGRYPWE